MIPTSHNPPLPEGFRERFIDPTERGGWRGVERAYRARRDVIMRWIAECGGPQQLAAARKAAIKAMKEEVRLNASLNRKATSRAIQHLRVIGKMPEL